VHKELPAYRTETQK